MIARVEIPGKPVAKKRPRRTNSGHVYTPSSAEELVVAKQIAALLKGVRFDGYVVVVVVFYGADPRADIDNLAKLYLDALTKAGVFRDDRYVSALWVERRLVDEHGPRTILCVDEWSDLLSAPLAGGV